VKKSIKTEAANLRQLIPELMKKTIAEKEQKTTTILKDELLALIQKYFNNEEKIKTLPPQIYFYFYFIICITVCNLLCE
jgi:septum formation topological specificity factor MinE